jgi:hypothetical protein
MPATQEITRTEQRIAEVDALQQTINQLRQDLQTYTQALRQELDWLRQEGAAPPPSRAPLPSPSPSVDPNLPQFTPIDEDKFIDLDQDIFGINQGVESIQGGPPAATPSPFELDDDQQPDRIGGKPVSVLISDGSVSEEPLSGWVLDRPPGGLKILVDDDIQVGSVIGVRPNREHPDAQWISVSVKSVRPERQSFVLTCQFVERPPWTALALFNS